MPREGDDLLSWELSLALEVGNNAAKTNAAHCHTLLCPISHLPSTWELPDHSSWSWARMGDFLQNQSQAHLPWRVTVITEMSVLNTPISTKIEEFGWKKIKTKQCCVLHINKGHTKQLPPYKAGLNAHVFEGTVWYQCWLALVELQANAHLSL